MAEFVFRRAWEESIPIIWYYYSDRPLAGALTAAMGWGLVRSDDTPRPAFLTIQEFVNSHER